ncbi:MAG: hypothetical protein EPN97_01555 [Alphaproteobacteria bacterium]|nr:MAG: hypothetical protein EPN97_01555 [Alphaproteobacteria bacterium]
MPHQDDFNDAADEWFALEEGSFPRVPRPLIAVRSTVDLPVLDTPGFQKNPDVVKAALLILSQSPTARKFAATAIAAGYSIFVDPPHLSGAGPQYDDGAAGNTDHLNRRINVAGGDDPLALAMVLAHELAHVSQIVDGGLDMTVSALHPLAAIKQLLAMEGDARAYEFLIASELSFRAKDDPEERLIFPSMLDVAAETIGYSTAAKIIAAAKPELEKGGDPAGWMARIFKGFYASPGLRDHYENTILFSLETLARNNPGTLTDAALFQGDMPQEELMQRLDSRGTPYLAAHAENYIDLDSPVMAGVSARTQERLAEFEKLRHRNPETLSQKSWQGEVYQLLPARKKPDGPTP